MCSPVVVPLIRPNALDLQVEFIDIDERSTLFPSKGWLTRRNLEDLIPTQGPIAMSSQQKARQEATRRAQEAGKRNEIKFAPGRDKDKPKEEKRYKESLDKRDRAVRALTAAQGMGFGAGGGLGKREREKEGGDMERRNGGGASGWDERRRDR